MTPDVYRFEFDGAVPINEAEMSLHLALFAVEGLFGQASVRLDAGYHVDEPRSAIVVDATTGVGAAVVRIFTSLLLHEFGGDGFNVRRIEPAPAVNVEGKAA
ncbi:MAG: hypothetical protein KKI02_02415 [Planctomycetes bacterium]|nr:hypothetical protein [Planctomycetota bacterium]